MTRGMTARKKSFEDLAAEVPLTAEDERELGMEAGEADDEEPAGEIPDEAAPDWAVLPPELKVPAGRQLYFVRFRAEWTDRPDKGDRQCILWSLTEADEKNALKRTRGDAMRGLDELSKQMVRAIDGKVVNWVGVSPATFWDEIGGRCRQLLKSHYTKTHMLGAEETADFFANCIAVRTAQP